MAAGGVSLNSSRLASQLWRKAHEFSASALLPKLRQMSTSQPALEKKLEGQVAIVTGGAGAIGESITRHFVANGAQVILADVADQKGQKLCSEIGSSTHYRHCDVSKEQDIASTVDFAMEKFGKLDIMVNNSGIISPIESFQNLSIEGYDRMTSVLVRGVVIGIKHASRVMSIASQGAILNTGSVASHMMSESFPMSYALCKTNIPGVTKVAAASLGKDGIRVNCISPHAIMSDLSVEWLTALHGITYSSKEIEETYVRMSTLKGKRCLAQDIANGALFFCSDDSRYVTGQTLIVDAGWANIKAFDVAGEIKTFSNEKGS